MRKFTRTSLCTLFFMGATLTLAQQKGISFESAKNSKSAKLVYIHADVVGFASNTSGSTSGLWLR